MKDKIDEIMAMPNNTTNEKKQKKLGMNLLFHYVKIIYD